MRSIQPLVLADLGSHRVSPGHHAVSPAGVYARLRAGLNSQNEDREGGGGKHQGVDGADAEDQGFKQARCEVFVVPNR